MLTPDIVYIRNSAKLLDVVNELIHSAPKILSIDSEGTGLDPHIDKMRLFQICHESIVYVIDVFVCDKVPELLNYLIKNLSKTMWVCQNWSFDMKFLWSLGVDFSRSILFDTMIAAQLIDAGLDVRCDLASICYRYLGVKLDKSQQKSDWSKDELDKDQILYAAKDTLYLKPLSKELHKYLHQKKQYAVFKYIEMRSLPAFAAMEWNGITLNTDKLSESLPYYQGKLQEAETHFLTHFPERYVRKDLFSNIIDQGISLTSPQQLLEAIRSLGIPNPLYNKDSPDTKLSDPIITSTAADVIKLLDVVDYPALIDLLDYRKINTLLTKYVLTLPKLVNPVTNRLHTKYNQLVSTGRASSSPNLQNLPRPNKKDLYTIRESFIPSEGYTLVGCDYSQIELRVIAEVIYQLTSDDTMLQEFLDGKDPYANTAALISNMTYDEFVALDPDIYAQKRQSSKAVRLGYNYCMSAGRFRNYSRIQYGVVMTAKEAKNNRKSYFAAYPGLTVYHQSFADKSIREARTLAPYNRARFFDVYPGIPALANHPIQGTSADILKLAMGILYDQLHDAGYSPTQSHDIRMLLNIHDEIVLECKHELGDLSINYLQTAMIEAAKPLKYCPVEAEAKLMENLSKK